MKKHEDFWIATILRGVLAILIGSGVLIVPDLARTILFLPFALAFVILSLAVYGVVDSVLVFITSFFTELGRVKSVLRLQSAFGVVLGALFCSIFFDRIHLEWFLYLIAIQAFATSCAEFMIACHTSREHGSSWCYVASAIALVCAATYAVVATVAPATLSTREIALLAYAYLAVFGVAQTLMATRMLIIERHSVQMAHAEGQ
jgi:uncharacterized membrane protein HdeD (DUF308 family)